MKLVMADPSLFTGRYDDALCAALARRGLDVLLAGRPLRATDAIAPEGYAYAPRFFARSERLPIGGAAKRVAKAADYYVDALAGSRRLFAGADVVHWQWLPFGPADAHWLRRLAGRHALVHTVHNARPFHGDNARARVQAGDYFRLLRRFDALIVHGEETRAALLERAFDAAVLHAVPHPPMRLAVASADDLAAVPASPRPRLLFFGTIRPYKGLDLLAEAAAMLWREGLDFDLAIAGQPFMPVDDLWQALRTADPGGRLHLDLGFLGEGRLDAHLQRADVVIFPYRHIDSSGAFLSALDYGAAMVTSDCGMFARLPEGSMARFPAGKAAALADTLRPLILSRVLREAAGQQARALSARLGSWDEAAALTDIVYAKAMAAARTRGAAR